MRKSRFNLTHMHSTTLDAGYLVPFCLIDCLPNDSFRISMNSFVRAQPMLAPLMHKVNLYTQYWYVPYRLLWDDWAMFITGGPDLQAVPALPTIKAGDSGFSVGSLADYFGFPINQAGIEVSAFPFRAYAEIWNARYRDEDLQEEVNVSYDENLDDYTNTSLLSPSWSKDYFTTARTSTQRGNEISVPIEQSSDETAFYTEYVFDQYIQDNTTGEGDIFWAELVDAQGHSSVNLNTWITQNINELMKLKIGQSKDITPGGFLIRRWGETHGASFIIKLVDIRTVQGVNQVAGVLNAGSTNLSDGNASITDVSPVWKTSSLATSGRLDIRDLRLASSLQRYQERSLKWGNRYEEFIQREFGLKPRDARIDRPEYLGGSQSVLQISEVLQTAESQNTGVGTMRGHGVASMRQRNIRFRCPEHGLIIGLMSIRPQSVYTQGIPRAWLRRSKFDFYTPELANIGMQEVYQQELYATNANKDVIFGFQDRYQEYRFMKPMVTGEFRTTMLNHWNMARNFSSPPVLNGSFINMSSSVQTFKRPFADTTQHSYLAMLRNNIIAYRPIPKRAKNILK